MWIAVTLRSMSLCSCAVSARKAGVGAVSSIIVSRMRRLSEVIGVTEFMISCVSTRISFCHESISR